MKAIRNILIKVSGDVVKRKEVLAIIRDKAKNNFAVILVGAGSDISKLLKEHEIKSEFNKAGRVIEGFFGRQLARDILEQHQRYLQNKLISENINAVVEIPVIKLGSVLCHMNGDNMVEACSVNFNETYVITLKGRNKKLEGHNLKIIQI